MNRSFNRGFTLIELLVVIAIIGILSSVVLASLNSARQKGRDARRVSDLKQLALALELMYDAQSQRYPIGATTAALAAAGSPTFVPTYISTMPADPQSGAYGYQSLTAANAACAANPCPSYVLSATTEGTKPSGSYNTNLGVGLPDCSGTNTYCIRP